MMHAHLWKRYRWQRRALLQCPCCERSKDQHIARQRWKHPQLNRFSSKCPLRRMNTLSRRWHTPICTCRSWARMSHLENKSPLTSRFLNTFQHQQPQQPSSRSGLRGEACFSSPSPWTPRGTGSLQPPEGPPDQQSGTSQPFSCPGNSTYFTVRQDPSAQEQASSPRDVSYHW